MFDFEVRRENDHETVSSLVSDDIVYITYWRADLSRGEINTYVTRLDKSGLIRRDSHSFYAPIFWGGPFTILYEGAK